MCGVLGVASTNSLVDELPRLFSHPLLLVRNVSPEEIGRLFAITVIIINPRDQRTKPMCPINFK